ncbi:MAG: translation initiation factor IF-3 [Rhodobacteraceae bacterium]|nr:MAG: translation initiation factor IF-3 [Paracoccaceae bacterium]
MPPIWQFAGRMKRVLQRSDAKIAGFSRKTDASTGLPGCGDARARLDCRGYFNHQRTTAIARRPHNAPPQRETGPRINDRIRSPEIRLIGADGENVGVVTPARAMQMAEEAGLDLVEISPTAEPPVCKIMDFGKFKYETQKREAEARKKQKIIEIKEIKFRPGTDIHDYEVKMRSIVKFLEEGDKVKVTLRFRGREMAHQELGLELLKRVESDVAEIGKIESFPRLEGRQMVMMVAPK